MGKSQVGKIKWPIVILLVALSSPLAAIISPQEQLPDAARETQARAIFKQLRCLVCQNESIDESDSLFAVDLRAVIRHQLMEGKQPKEIINYLKGRYGEYIVLNPALSWSTLLLWVIPAFALIIGLAAATYYYWRHRPKTKLLSPAEEEELTMLLAKEENGQKD